MKKRIEIELLPKDFKGNEFQDASDCPLVRAVKRVIKCKNASCFERMVSIDIGRRRFAIVDEFDEEDHDYVKDAYTKDPKALKAIYVVTLEEV